jgi:fucose permease
MNASMLAGSLVVGLAMDRFGMKPALAIGAWLVAAGVALVAFAADLGDLLPAVALLGLGGAALNAGTNTLVADLHDDPKRKASALNRLGVFFGFGALFLPFMIGALTARFGLPALLLAAAVLCLVTGFTAAALRFPPAKQAHGVPLREMSRFLRVPFVLVAGALLFLQSGNEFVLGGYLATFLTREHAVSIEAASYMLAAYWASLMVARGVVSRMLLSHDADRMLVGSAIAAAAGALLIAFSPSARVAVLGIVTTAAALASIFPIMLGKAGTRFPEHSGTVFGVLFTMALTGGMTMPWLASRLAQAAGLRWVFVLVAGAFVVIATLGRVVRR